MQFSRLAITTALLAGVSLISSPADAAQHDEAYQFDIASQDLGDALSSVAARVGLELYARSADVKGIVAPPLHGSFDARAAIGMLLQGTGLTARFSQGSVLIERAPQTSGGETDGAAGQAIIVTGTRIRGAPPAAPVTVVTSEDINNAGQSDLGEVARSLPINFGGGQNPGVGNSQGSSRDNTNTNGAETFNLRGIGSDATLTLLNGNRLADTGINAAVDISSIPIAAVKRIEIVPDGASAIYGSDAVAGVVNIVLQPDYTGLTTSARIGGSTDGGNLQQQYDVTGGSRWASGGFIASYDYFRNSAITADQRSYASSTNPQSTLYPALERHSLLVSAHQNLSSTIKLGTDFIFKSGRDRNATGYNVDQPVSANGIRTRLDLQTLGIVPTLQVTLPRGWDIKVTGYYGTDKTNGPTISYANGASTTGTARFNNETLSMIADAEGPLFELPAGAVRLAIGSGIRRYDFSSAIGSTLLAKNRQDHYAYGEIFLPLVGTGQKVPFARELSLTGAIRVEDYSDSARIATPKLGIIYAPVKDVDIKLSWGRSYKVPSLYRQYSGFAAVLLPVSGYGNAFPAGSTFIELLGANPQEQAEHSENWIASIETHPISGLDFSVDYFHIDYTDRVAQPLTTSAGALTNPLYASFVTLNPTAAQISAASNGAALGLQNGTGRPFDPSTVSAILDIRDRNVESQVYKGVDLSVRYRTDLDAGHQLLLSAAGTWLKSQQELLPGLPATELAGTIFHPPHLKARGGATFSGDRFSISSFVNYTGPVVDDRLQPHTQVPGLTTLDLTGRVHLEQIAEFSLELLNVFNAKPNAIYTTSPYDTPFDTTNFSAVGRFIGVTVSCHW